MIHSTNRAFRIIQRGTLIAVMAFGAGLGGGVAFADGGVSPAIVAPSPAPAPQAIIPPGAPIPAFVPVPVPVAPIPIVPQAPAPVPESPGQVSPLSPAPECAYPGDVAQNGGQMPEGTINCAPECVYPGAVAPNGGQMPEGTNNCAPECVYPGSTNSAQGANNEATCTPGAEVIAGRDPELIGDMSATGWRWILLGLGLTALLYGALTISVKGGTAAVVTPVRDQIRRLRGTPRE